MPDALRDESPKSRPWRDIAKQLATEKDSSKILGLAEELRLAYDEQTHGSPEEEKPDTSTNGRLL
jgi:hypothetical protein